MSRPNAELDLAFVDAVYKELCGQSLVEDVDNNQQSHATSYQFNPHKLTKTDESLFDSQFLKNTVGSTHQRMRQFFGSPDAEKACMGALAVAAVKFGMLLQKRANEKSHLIA
jgi:hypothetical protein